ncbi:MAG TPA: retropepsin-like aspartic protease [Vicinamibacterales bacterium]|nr:retropepsin-like aspartic protease [Vicinamibacterales bacterium]
MAFHKRFTACVVGLSFAGIMAAQPGEDAFRPLAKTHRWFELRATANARTSPLVRGALAAAFNDPTTAERLLRGVIRDEPRSEAADDAYALLAFLYLRTGQYERFATLYQAWAAALPQSVTVRDERENFEKYRGRPNQVNGRRRQSVVRHDKDGYLTLPISIDGKTDDFIFDTGALQSTVTEREARKLGLTIQDDPRTLIDISGTRTTFRTAVAKEVMLGSMTFRNVSFAVITPGGALADAEFGIIGLPIIVAMGGINWSNSGTAEFGGPFPGSGGEPNLVFDRSRLVLRAEVLGKGVLATFDTGANSTDLNANFANLFPDIVATGRKGSADLNGIGGTQTFASVELPELIFTIGSSRLPLRPAVITMQQNSVAGGECCIANAGHDLLKQGQGFLLNLAAMTLQVR